MVKKLSKSNLPLPIGMEFNSRFSTILNFQVPFCYRDIWDESLPGRMQNIVEIGWHGDARVGLDIKGEDKPERTLYGFSRLLGRPFNNVVVQDEVNRYPFQVVEQGNEPRYRIRVRNKWVLYSPEEVVAMAFEKWRAILAKEGHQHFEIVLVVPNAFNKAQKSALLYAAELADFTITRMIDSATALAYSFNIKHDYKLLGSTFTFLRDVQEGDEVESRLNKSGNFLFVDLAEDNIDVCVICHDEEANQIKILAKGGDTALGGDLFTRKLENYIVKRIRQEHGRNIRKDLVAARELGWACQAMRERLFFKRSARLKWKSKKLRVDIEVSREKFNELCIDLFAKVRTLVHKVIKESGISKKDITLVQILGQGCHLRGLINLLRKTIPVDHISWDHTSSFIHNGVSINGQDLRAITASRAIVMPCDLIDRYHRVLHGASCLAHMLSDGGGDRRYDEYLKNFDVVDVSSRTIII